MWRVPGERLTLDLDGPAVEVEQIRSWFVQFEALALLGSFVAADQPAEEYRALAALYDRFVAEAQPTWDIVDHLGAVPNTARGMTRLPLDLGLAMVSEWAGSLPAKSEEPASAVDAVIPPGPFNREVKRRLRSVKAA